MNLYKYKKLRSMANVVLPQTLNRFLKTVYVQRINQV